MTPQYKAYGIWKVTTEGDCEGKTVKDLGVHEGYLDEIALKLGGQSYYSLHFQALRERPEQKWLDPVKSVSVSLGIDSKTWDLSASDRANAAREILKDRPVTVKTGQWYASFVIEAKEDSCPRK